MIVALTSKEDVQTTQATPPPIPSSSNMSENESENLITLQGRNVATDNPGSSVQKRSRGCLCTAADKVKLITFYLQFTK